MPSLRLLLLAVRRHAASRPGRVPYVRPCRPRTCYTRSLHARGEANESSVCSARERLRTRPRHSTARGEGFASRARTPVMARWRDGVRARCTWLCCVIAVTMDARVRSVDRQHGHLLQLLHLCLRVLRAPHGSAGAPDTATPPPSLLKLVREVAHTHPIKSNLRAAAACLWSRASCGVRVSGDAHASERRRQSFTNDGDLVPQAHGTSRSPNGSVIDDNHDGDLNRNLPTVCMRRWWWSSWSRPPSASA